LTALNVKLPDSFMVSRKTTENNFWFIRHNAVSDFYLLSSTCPEVSGVENIGQRGRLSQPSWLLGAL